MNPNEFNYLSIGQRAKLVWQHGRFLAILRESGCSKFLYHVGGFFVEVWYSPAREFVILIHGFEEQESLAPYLDQVDISELIREE